MEYRQLGKSSLRISTIGFGCMSLKNETASDKIIHQAIDLGINFFDTADLYDRGENEIMLGRALARKRNQLYIATKVGNEWKADRSGWEWNPSSSYIVSAVEKSLKRLKTDYIDLYQMHGGMITDPVDEVVETMEHLVMQGKVRHYGISSIRPNVINTWIRRSRLTSVMMQYSLLDKRPEENCLNLLFQHQTGVLARGSLAQGLLTGKPPVTYLEHPMSDVQNTASLVSKIANGKPAAGVAISYVLQHPAVTSAIVGIRNMDHLNQAVNALEQYPLKDEDYVNLKNNVPAHIYREHRS